MARKTLRIFLGTVIAVVCLPFIMFGVLIVGQNILPAVYYTAFTTQPTAQEVPGKYEASLPWGKALLDIRSDGTFAESVSGHNSPVSELVGSWTTAGSSDNGGLILFCKPFIGISFESQLRQERSSLTFFRSRLGGMFANYVADDPDSPTTFKKQ